MKVRTGEDLVGNLNVKVDAGGEMKLTKKVAVVTGRPRGSAPRLRKG